MVRSSLVLVGCLLLGACSSTPTLRPATPLPDGRVASVAAAAGAQGGVGSDGTQTFDRVGGLGALSFRYALNENLELTALGHGGGALGILRSPSGELGGKFGGAIYGGNVGGRFVYPVLEGLRIGAGFHLDYLEQSYVGQTQRHVSAMVTMPTAEKLYEGIWVYVRPTVGIAISLYDGAEIPFFGITECPIGISWQVNDRFALLAEGGYYLPTNGVNALIGASAQF